MCLLISLEAAVNQERKNPRAVEAAFLRNFAHYVEWPSDAFIDERSPWLIGILGKDPFGDILETTFKNRTEKGRSFKVFRANSLNELPVCHIIFITFKNASQRRWTLGQLKDKPVLTVSDLPEFLQEGGVIHLKVNDRVHINVNLDQARAVDLIIQTKMLEVASSILEDGVIHKVR